MKQIGPDEKQGILEEKGILYLYNDMEERAVKLEFNNGDWKATVKTPWGEEIKANYDKSRICGDAFVYGDVMTEEEYNKFPDGIELSELAKEEIEENKDYYMNLHKKKGDAGIDEAIALAAQKFKGRRDKDGNPDVLHSLYVGLSGKNRMEMVVGFLHDVVEDTDVTFEDLSRMGYAAEVIETLKLLTHRKEVPYMDYVRNIGESGNPVAIAVKLNDLNHNLLRGKAGGHTDTVAKHTAALELLDSILKQKEK